VTSAIGPGACAALPWLRQQATATDRDVAAAAAHALYTIGGEDTAALAVYDRLLAGDQYDQRAAAEGFGRLGPEAADRVGQLRVLLRRKDPYCWLRLTAARALWQITGEPEATLPVLARAWTANRLTRVDVAETWADMGAAAADARPLLEAELAGVRRHNADRHGGSSDQVVDDERLLRACRAARSALAA
jgi:hypothetical protein